MSVLSSTPATPRGASRGGWRRAGMVLHGAIARKTAAEGNYLKYPHSIARSNVCSLSPLHAQQQQHDRVPTHLCCLPRHQPVAAGAQRNRAGAAGSAAAMSISSHVNPSGQIAPQYVVCCISLKPSARPHCNTHVWAFARRSIGPQPRRPHAVRWRCCHRRIHAACCSLELPASGSCCRCT